MRVTRPTSRTAFESPLFGNIPGCDQSKFELHRRAGGGGGIRTHEAFRPAGFQDRSHKPLDHPSENLDREKCATAERLSKRASPIQAGCSVEHNSTKGYVHVNLLRAGGKLNEKASV